MALSHAAKVWLIVAAAVVAFLAIGIVGVQAGGGSSHVGKPVRVN